MLSERTASMFHDLSGVHPEFRLGTNETLMKTEKESQTEKHSQLVSARTVEMFQEISDDMKEEIANSNYNGIAGIEVSIKILHGDDLAPKDRNIFTGRATSSDPYIEVWKNLPTQMVGRTSTIYKTLTPFFNEAFAVKWTKKELSRSLNDRHRAKLTLKVWDEDQLSAPDAMGDVDIVLPLPDECLTIPKAWYSIDPHSAKNAKGRIMVSMTVQYHREEEKLGSETKKDNS